MRTHLRVRVRIRVRVSFFKRGNKGKSEKTKPRSIDQNQDQDKSCQVKDEAETRKWKRSDKRLNTARKSKAKQRKAIQDKR